MRLSLFYFFYFLTGKIFLLFPTERFLHHQMANEKRKEMKKKSVSSEENVSYFDRVLILVRPITVQKWSKHNALSPFPMGAP